eukprot:sb/3463794/
MSFKGEPTGNGWPEFIKDSGQRELKVNVSVTIKNSYFGQESIWSRLNSALQNLEDRENLHLGIKADRESTIIFNGNICLTNELTEYISFEQSGRTWIVEIEKPVQRRLKLKVNGYYTATGVVENLDESVVVLVRQNPTLRQCKQLGQAINFNLGSEAGASVLATFIIIANSVCEKEPAGTSSGTKPAPFNPTSIEQPTRTSSETNQAPFNPESIKKSGGVDFGKEYLSLPAHGNNSFVLRDNTNIPLNSYILSRNSPVLKNLIEEVGEIDHDVSDFEPQSVRIFVDTCYTGKLDKLVDSTEFKVFSDFIKMVAVFKVAWAKEGCLVFFKNRLPKSLTEFTGYWECALLALDCSVKFGDDKFLTHIFSSVPENKTSFQFKISRLLAATSKRPEMDLVMALVVQFELHSTFVQHLISILDIGHSLPLQDYILENFNFSLCDKETISFLSEALSRCISPEYACNFMKSVETERLRKACIEDGTLATLARNLWLNTEDSNWPCSNKKPFSQTKRNLTLTLLFVPEGLVPWSG